MASRKRNGFTLVELLVVIMIIGMLMALIFPAVASAMEVADKVTCKKNLGELAKSMQLFESNHGHLPGYLHRVRVRQGRSNPQMKNFSWVVAALETLKTEDYKAITLSQSSINYYFSVLNCPRDPSAQNDASISYVANCGMLDGGVSMTEYPDRIGNGVFHREGPKSQGKFVKMTSDRILGQAQTIMFSENRQAGMWTSTKEADIGILWSLDEQSPNYPEPETKMINNGGDAPAESNPNYARPSSNHAGGVVVVFCGGNAKFIKQDIPYSIYCKLMMSDSSKAGLPGPKNAKLPDALQGAIISLEKWTD